MLIHIVDDSASNLMTIAHMVSQAWGAADVALLEDPTESLARCRDAMPDLILVDYMMPGMDGIRYIEEIRQMPGAGSVPILMITACTEPDVEGRALRAGATGFLTKPLRGDDMRGKLSALLDGVPAARPAPVSQAAASG